MAFCPSDESQLDAYLREVSETPALSPEEERQLAYRVEQGDSEARDRLVRANLRSVVGIAQRHADRGLTFRKLLEEGTLGLLLAVEAFDPASGTRFADLANEMIGQTIRRALSRSETGGES